MTSVHYYDEITIEGADVARTLGYNDETPLSQSATADRVPPTLWPCRLLSYFVPEEPGAFGGELDQ